jgi:hypothetical protein
VILVSEYRQIPCYLCRQLIPGPSHSRYRSRNIINKIITVIFMMLFTGGCMGMYLLTKYRIIPTTTQTSMMITSISSITIVYCYAAITVPEKVNPAVKTTGFLKTNIQY